MLQTSVIKHINPAAKKEITFLPTLFCKLNVHSNVAWFLHSDHVHIGAIKILRKVPFKFSSYLTLFPFYEVSLVFVLFLFGEG